MVVVTIARSEGLNDVNMLAELNNFCFVSCQADLLNLVILHSTLTNRKVSKYFRLL